MVSALRVYAISNRNRVLSGLTLSLALVQVAVNAVGDVSFSNRATHLPAERDAFRAPEQWKFFDPWDESGDWISTAVPMVNTYVVVLNEQLRRG